MHEKHTRYSYRYRPDQTVYKLNRQAEKVAEMSRTIRVDSDDGSATIIIGNQPDRTFGIKQYKIKGDRLELEKEF